MLKSLIKSMFVIAIVIVSVMPVGAVNEPAASTEVITEVVTEQQSEQPTEVITEVVTDMEVHTEYEVLCFILFGIAIFVGIEMARAFSFWKW